MMRANSVADVEVDEHSAFIADLLELFVLKVEDVKNLVKHEFGGLEQRLQRMENTIAQELSSEFPTKPDCLPFKTRGDIEEFEDVGNDTYKEVITFLGSLSIGDLKQTTNLILKHAISNSLAAEVAWLGGEPGTLVLQRTRFPKALYAASARNKAYDKPRWEDFSIAITTALKAAK